MKGRLLRVAAGLSLLLCVVAALLWVRSMGHIDELQLATPYHWLSLLSGGGNIRYIHLFLDYPGISQIPGEPPRQPEPGWDAGYRSEDDIELLYGMIIIHHDDAPRFWRWLPVSVDTGQPSDTFSESPPYAWGGRSRRHTG